MSYFSNLNINCPFPVFQKLSAPTLIFLSLILTINLSVFASSPEIAPIVSKSPSKAYKYTLKNGLKVIVVPDSRNPVATLHFILDAGSDREKIGATGLAHFFEHMMFRKTTDAPEGNYDRVLNSIGGRGNAGTSDSFVTFYSTFPAPALETMLKLEADRFTNLDIADPYFTTEKGAVISERKLRVENDPIQRSREILRSITEKGTPMEWMTIGSKADVENMTLASAKEFYTKFYTPDNTLLVLGGPFKPQYAIEMVEKYFGSWQGKLTEQHPNYPANYYSKYYGKSFVCSTAVNTKRFQIVYPTMQSNEESLAFTTLFQAMLDDNPDGTFMRRLRKSQLATNFSFYQVYWQNQSRPYLASFSLTKDQNFERTKAFWLKNINDVLKKPLTTKIINQVLKQMAVSNAEATELMTSLVNAVIDNDFFLHDFYAAGKVEKLVQNVQEKKFKDWIKKTFQEKNFYSTGIVPSGEETPCVDFHL